MLVRLSVGICALFFTLGLASGCGFIRYDPIERSSGTDPASLAAFGSCSNGILDSGESAIDCGGDCTPCSTFSACESDRDCASGSCIQSICEGSVQGEIALYTFEDSPAFNEDFLGDHPATVRGAITQRDAPGIDELGKCAYFPGNAFGDEYTNDYVEVSQSDVWDLSKGSLDFWMHPLSDRVAGLVSRDALFTTERGHFVVQRQSDGTLLVRIQGSINDTGVQLCSSERTPSGQWTHVGVNWGVPNAELYIDHRRATLNDCDLPGDNDTGIDGNSNPWVFGGSSAWSDDGEAGPVRLPFHGYLDNIRITGERQSFDGDRR